MISRSVYYIIHIFSGLIIAQSLTSDSNIINIFGLGLLLTHSIIIVYIIKDHFLFVVYLISLCIIQTFDKLGGIILAPLIILITIYFQNQERFLVKDRFIRACVSILVLTNFLGYILINQARMLDIISSVIIFSGSILTFLFIQNFKLSKIHINTIFKIFTFLSILLLLIALNQKYVFIDSTIGLLGAGITANVSRISRSYDGRMPSLIQDYELFSEFALLMFIISFTIFFDRRAINFFKLGYTPFILAFISIANMLITGTRSSIILTILFLFILSLLRMGSFFSAKTLIYVLVIAGLIPLFMNYGELIGLDIVINRIKEIDIKAFSLHNIITGEEINRAYVFAEGYSRLAENDWILGHGFGTANSNEMAWFGNITSTGGRQIVDFHSLYLCIPMIYGWIGGVTYLILIIYIIILLFKKYLLVKNDPGRIIALAFSLMFIFFLINQIKINSLRLYNYHYLIWILLGFALSIAKMKLNNDEDSLVY